MFHLDVVHCVDKKYVQYISILISLHLRVEEKGTHCTKMLDEAIFIAQCCSRSGLSSVCKKGL